MSSILVEDGDTFDLVVKYAEKDGWVAVLPDDSKEGKSLRVTFRKPDFSTSQAILSQSMYYQNGESSLNMVTMKNVMLYTLAKSWDAKDAKGGAIPLTPESIGKLRVEIAKALTLKLMEHEGENVI